MKQERSDFAPTLAEAQKMGYAEADPATDVDGFDSMHKTGILASLAHGFWAKPGEIYVEGIRAVTKVDIEFAEKLGYTIKLLGVVKVVANASAPGKRKGGGKPIQVSVYPALLPNTHVLASVNDVFNAVFVRGDVVGDTLFYGRGAGKDATASAVMSDIADAALDLKHGTKNRIPAFVPHSHGGGILPMAQVVSRYYLRLSVADKPGTLARIAALLAKSKIGIASVFQPEGDEGGVVPLILMTHAAPNAAMQKALQAIARSPVVKAPPLMLRVESFD
jgi:homoserine dehydrogenase